MFGRHIGAIAAMAVWASSACAAFGGGVLPWPVVGSAVRVFGESYPASGETLSHHGTDLLAEPGQAVLSPSDGEVAFAGAVPAAGGGTRLALTLVLPGGERVTLMPLESVAVSRGDNVSAGVALGTVAADGDASWAATHLHVGVRRGTVYIDPASVFSSDTAAHVPAPSPVTGPMTAPADPPAAPAVATPAPSRSPAVRVEAHGMAAAAPVALVVGPTAELPTRVRAAEGEEVPADGPVLAGAVETGVAVELPPAAALAAAAVPMAAAWCLAGSRRFGRAHA